MMCSGEKGNQGTVSFQMGKKRGLPADCESQPAKPHWEEIMRFLPHRRGMLLSYTLTLCLGKNFFVVLTSGKNTSSQYTFGLVLSGCRGIYSVVFS